MGKIRVSFDVDDGDEEVVDNNDPTGLTEDAYGSLLESLMDWGANNISVTKGA